MCSMFARFAVMSVGLLLLLAREGSPFFHFTAPFFLSGVLLRRQHPRAADGRM
jgi:hypothetical protein